MQQNNQNESDMLSQPPKPEDYDRIVVFELNLYTHWQPKKSPRLIKDYEYVVEIGFCFGFCFVNKTHTKKSNQFNRYCLKFK